MVPKALFYVDIRATILRGKPQFEQQLAKTSPKPPGYFSQLNRTKPRTLYPKLCKLNPPTV